MITPGGFALLCEQTDPDDKFAAFQTRIRSRRVDVEDPYERWLKPMTLLKSSERVNEPTYKLQKVGSYMLFQKPAE